MSLEYAIFLTTKFISFAILLIGFENFLISRSHGFTKVWNYKNLKNNFETGLLLPKNIIQILLSNRTFQTLSLLQISIAILSLILSSPYFIILLFIIHLLICLRFRGNFNGGSDMMIFVVLTGLIISLWSANPQTQKLGLIYIAIHGIYSYFKAGFVKLRHPDWRHGIALPVFLQRSLFKHSHQFSNWLENKKALALILSWGIIIFEIAALTLALLPKISIAYCLCALFFHFLIFLIFGLNRFFWSWLSAWPAILFAVSMMQ